MPASNVARFAELREEENRRAREALNCYRPVPGDQEKFHRSKAHEILLRGGKRSGKSIASACEFASRVLGIPIKDANGNDIPIRWTVPTPKDKRIYFVIGWDVNHIGQTIYRLLFEPGLFRVVQDPTTGVWRTWNPEADAKLFDKSVPAGPLIPERMIQHDTWNWENKAEHYFKSVELTNGAIIRAYPSSARQAKQGDAVMGIWIDEDIQIPSHLKEWQDRLTTHDGWFLWSVWPHEKNIALEELVERAEEDEAEEEPIIESFNLVMSQNPFYSSKAKDRALKRMGSDEEIARRDRGELMWETVQMYDMNSRVHLMRPFEAHAHVAEPTNPIDVIRQILTGLNKLPAEWTRYLALDPSHTRTAVMFGVVPPPHVGRVNMGNMLILEDELVMKRTSPNELAFALREKMQGLSYEAFIMDQNMGRQTRVGNDSTVFEAYAEAFAKHGIKSRTTGSSFIPGVNVPTIRYRAVRELLWAGNGTPRLVLVDHTTRETQKEFQRYRKKKLIVANEEIILDEPSNPRKYDCMAAVEYLVAYIEPLFKNGGAYIEPNRYSGTSSHIRLMADELNKSRKEGYVHLGPGVAA